MSTHIIILPAIMSSTELILSSTCWMSPTSVLVCRFRTLFRRMAVNMLQISAWQVTSQCSNSSTMQPMLSASWMMKFVSRSNSPPTNYKREKRKMSQKNAFLYKPQAGFWFIFCHTHVMLRMNAIWIVMNLRYIFCLIHLDLDLPNGIQLTNSILLSSMFQITALLVNSSQKIQVRFIFLHTDYNENLSIHDNKTVWFLMKRQEIDTLLLLPSTTTNLNYKWKSL